MNKSKTYRSDAFAAIHQTAQDMRDAGVMDQQTMRRFDESCLTTVEPFSPQQIRALRKKEKISQAILAYHLNVSKDSVSQWERGVKKPAGPSLKLLSLAFRKGLSAIA